MELKQTASKLTVLLKKYKYAILILLLGIGLMLIPTGNKEAKTADKVQLQQQPDLASELEEIISTIRGAGQVKVMLSVGRGEETVYQTDTDESTGTENGSRHVATVTVTDAQRAQVGLIRQINPVIYQGAVVVCQGADDPEVRLAVVEAISKATGLGANQICVLKMK